MVTSPDPLDIGEPRRKSWEEFRTSFAAAFQHVWLLDELEMLEPRYLDGLMSRFEDGMLNAEEFVKQDPEYDGAVPVQDVSDGGVTFIDRDVAELVYIQLFPNSRSGDSLVSNAYGLTIVGLHSALESYARAIGAMGPRSPLPVGVRAFLKANGCEDLDAETADLLSDLDASRHIIVHNRGIVDERYIRSVKAPTVELGEYRPITSTIVHRFAQAAWRVAGRLRDAGADAA